MGKLRALSRSFPGNIPFGAQEPPSAPKGGLSEITVKYQIVKILHNGRLMALRMHAQNHKKARKGTSIARITEY
jgi:hypothetical protein